MSPKGLAVGTAKDLIVAQGAFGPAAPVLSYVLHGRGRGSVNEVTDPVNLIDVAISPLDDTGWGIGPVETGDVHLFHQLDDGTVIDVLNITAYQAAIPIPSIRTIRHSRGVEPVRAHGQPDGNALVADAAGNDILNVTPAGDATTVARFDLELVNTDHLPPEFPVPSGDHRRGRAHLGDDRARRRIYVGELMGFPFRPARRTSGASTRTPTGVVLGRRSVAAARCTAGLHGDPGHRVQPAPVAFRLRVRQDGVFAFEADDQRPVARSRRPSCSRSARAGNTRARQG